jgi:hypothetical protein
LIRRTTRAAFAAILLLLPFSLGCDYAPFGIVIGGFDEYQVEGINLWRRNEQTGQYQRAGSIVFDRTAADWSNLEGEVIAFTNGSGGIELPAEVVRDPANPDRVTLRLAYLRMENPGLYKATLYNAAGESALSTQAITL